MTKSSIFDYFKQGTTPIIGSAKQFFTQPMLTQMSIDVGLTQDSIDRLKDFNKLTREGMSITSAYKQTMKGASVETKAMARNVANGSVQVAQLSTSSKAAALGMQALNAAMNIGISLAISAAITWIAKLIHAQENAYQEAKRLSEETKQTAEQKKAEYQQVNELIAKYKELRESETGNSVEVRSQLLNLQQEITDLVGKQAANVDLVNGKLEDQLELLRGISNEEYKNVVAESEKAYRAAAEETKEYKPKGSIYSGEILDLDLSKYLSANDQAGMDIIDKVLKDFEVGKLIRPSSLDGYFGTVLSFDSNTTWKQRLDFLNALIDELRTSAEFNTSETDGLYDGLITIRDDLADVVGEESQAALNYLQSLTVLQSDQNTNGIQSVKDFAAARQAIIDNITNDGSVQNALLSGVLDNSDIEKFVNDYLSTLNGVSDYYDSWAKQFVTNSDYEKAKAMLGFKDDDATFNYEEYKEQIEEITKSIDTLSSAYTKLKDGTATPSEMLSLFNEYPDLAQYANDTGLLAEKVKELANHKPDDLIQSLKNLATTIKDPEQKRQIEGLVLSLEKLSSLSTGINQTASAIKNVTVDDYIRYEENNIQRIIDKLEKKKDAQEEILNNLKAQKEELEDIISKYEKTADIVGDYIDSSQIKPLENRKSDIEEYYNTQIDKLKEENEERDRNIELQEKQDALANARKTKIRRYDETQGWVHETDVSSIQKAEKELSNLKNEIAIDDLEKRRDSEVKDIETQIKVWEDYKDEWKEQVDQIAKADNELIASKILGANWHEKISKKDIQVMTTYGNEYKSYNNRLKNQVNVEISAAERAIKSRENEINKWKTYKDDVSNLNKDISDSNNEYLENLNQFVLDENSTWEKRIAHMRRNVEIIKQLKAKAEGVSVSDTSSDIYVVEQGDKTLGWYNSKEEAERQKRKLAENMAKSKIPSGAPSGVLETIIQSIMKSMSIRKYASGGVNSTTGLAWLDGKKVSSEVVFNSQQAKQLYDMVSNGDFSRMISDNIVSTFKSTLGQLMPKNTKASTSANINISFPNAQINARDYDTFKGFMDRYIGDLYLQMQTGNK